MSFNFNDSMSIEDEISEMNSKIDIDKYMKEKREKEEKKGKKNKSTSSHKKSKKSKGKSHLKLSEKVEEINSYDEIEEEEEENSEESEERKEKRKIGDKKMRRILKKFNFKYDEDLKSNVENKMDETGLSREDYERIEEIYERELSDRYILKKPGYKEGTETRFAQIYKKDTSKKLWIDIFPIDYVSDNCIKKYLVGITGNLLMGIAGSIEFIDNCDKDTKDKLVSSFNGAINYYLRKIISKLFGWRSLDAWYAGIERTVRNKKNATFCTSSLGRWHYFGEMQKSDVFFPLKESSFCGIKAWTLNKERQYLEHNYGLNYMEIPSEQQRETHC